MANIITDLQLIDDVQETANFAVDDGIQTYRATANQIKDFILPNQGLNLEKLSEALIELLTPTASVLIYPVATAPPGWLLCNGAAVSRSTYAKLFEKIGITHGQGNGSTTFNIPDYRHRFIRGTGDGATREPYRASRIAMNTGGNTGDQVGSVSANYYTARSTVAAMNAGSAGAHTHDFEADSSTVSPVYNSGSGTIVATNNALGRRSAAGNKYTVSGAVQSNGAHTHSISGGGDNETAPINAHANFIIKF